MYLHCNPLSCQAGALLFQNLADARNTFDLEQPCVYQLGNQPRQVFAEKEIYIYITLSFEIMRVYLHIIQFEYSCKTKPVF